MDSRGTGLDETFPRGQARMKINIKNEIELSKLTSKIIIIGTVIIDLVNDDIRYISLLVIIFFTFG